MNPHIFRKYDIRGLADSDLESAVVTDIGRALGTEVVESGGASVVVGRDARESSPRIRDALADGLTAVGCSVVDIGLCPTPLLYFAANFYPDIDGLVMVTGSHNPPDHNGLKLGVGAVTMGGERIQALRQRIARGHFHRTSERGAVTERDVLAPYLAYLDENLVFGPGRPRVILDAGNGVGGITAMPMLEQAGFPVEGLYLEPDGTFPNHEADPTVEENLVDLRDRVLATGADLGVAYDGDADRLGVVDGDGGIVWGDRLMILFARAILERTPGAAIVGEVKCSKTLYDEIARLGGHPVMWKAGHTLIKAKMKEVHAAAAGEMSGHLFFADRYYGFDDACYATGRLLEILSREDRGVSELLADVPPTFSTPELRLDCPEELKFDLVDAVRDRLADGHDVIDVDGVRVTFPDGWGLVRASNTQPLLVLRFEAESEPRLDEIRSLVEEAVEAERARLEATRS